MLELGQLHLFDLLHQLGVYPADGDGGIDITGLIAQRHLGGRYLGGAGGNKRNADLLRLEAGLFHGGAAGQHGGQLHGGLQRQQMLQKIGEADPDKPQHGRTGRGDERQRALIMRHVFLGGLGDEFRGGAHLVNLIEADALQGQNDAAGVVQMLDLGEEHRCGQRYLILEAIQCLHGIADSPLGVVGADADALAAIDAALAQDAGLAIPNPNGLGRAALDAGDAAVAQILIERNGVKIGLVFHLFLA